ncbi:hypothetical protein E5347_04635 [Clostridium sartagoforme]|uniref:Uncharacterized protein n=1 Tax=Clostridium sartagoforme TaxID=84031 RepID=A0A4S2DQ82_9CLOT|nr:hypothetical protein E5347_04635 [Clostridium sartagoforme]
MNIHGLVIMIIIMIPNIVFAMREKNFESKYNNKLIEVIEQIGRLGSMFLMIFNISFLNYGYWFSNAKKVYMILVGVLALAYCLTWVLYFKKATISKAMALAIIPTLIFLFSGLISLNILLIITSVLFGIGHLTITYYNNV